MTNQRKQCTLCGSTSHDTTSCGWRGKPTWLFALSRVAKAAIKSPAALFWSPLATIRTMRFHNDMHRALKAAVADGASTEHELGKASAVVLVKYLGHPGLRSMITTAMVEGRLRPMHVGMMEYQIEQIGSPEAKAAIQAFDRATKDRL